MPRGFVMSLLASLTFLCMVLLGRSEMECVRSSEIIEILRGPVRDLLGVGCASRRLTCKLEQMRVLKK